MKDLSDRLLAIVRNEPGELSIETLGPILEASKSDLRKVARALARDGMLAPRAYRLYSHVGPATRLGLWRADGYATAHAIVDSLRDGPLTAKELAEKNGFDSLPGGWKRALDQLHEYGIVSLSVHLWPTQDSKPKEASNANSK